MTLLWWPYFKLKIDFYNHYLLFIAITVVTLQKPTNWLRLDLLQSSTALSMRDNEEGR